MCFSKEISLFSFLYGTITSLLVYRLGSDNDKLVGLFIMYVSLMQLIEYLLWINQHCNKRNKIISIVGLFLNHTQPIILGLLILNKNVNKKLILLVMFIYLLCAIKYSLQFNKYDMCTIKNKYNHLEWKWNQLENGIIFYWIFTIILLYLFSAGVKDSVYSLFFCISTIVSLLTSIYFYNRYNVTGALWCFYIVFFPTIYYSLRINEILK